VLICIFITNLWLQSVTEMKYDHLAAIYHLLLDRCRKQKKLINTVSPSHLPAVTRTERRSSITTGVGMYRQRYHIVLRYIFLKKCPLDDSGYIINWMQNIRKNLGTEMFIGFRNFSNCPDFFFLFQNSTFFLN